MSFVRWKVMHYAINASTTPASWNPVGTEITDFFDPMINVSLGDKKDSFQIKLSNPYGRWDNFFKANDKIEIYRITNATTFASTDIVMVGVLRNVPVDSSGTKDTIRLEGYNLGEAITTGIVFYDTGDVEKTPLEIVKGALESLALQNSNFVVTWSNDNPLLTKKNGSTPFTKYKTKYFYKPLSKVIEDMLSDSYTQDGAYFWWVDRDNKLQIRPNTVGDPRTYTQATDMDTVAYKDARDTSAVKNFIILRGGLDPSGKPIQVVRRDFTSISKNGMKYHFAISKTINAQSLNQRDTASVDSKDRYPVTYPFDTTWYASYTAVVEGVSVTLGSKVRVNNDTEYREVLREEIKTQLIAQADEIISGTAYGKLQVDLSTNAGSKGWNLGDRVTCNIPRLGITNKELRVKEIQKTTDMDVYSLEEDIGTI